MKKLEGAILEGARLFGDYLGVIFELFCEDLGGKTIQRVNAKIGNTIFFTI